MRIALFNIDSLCSNASTLTFIERMRDRIVLLGQSPPFRRSRGGVVAQSIHEMTRRHPAFSTMLWCNFMLPRIIGSMPMCRPALAAACRRYDIRRERIEDVNSVETRELLAALRVDLIVSSYFDQIFDASVIALAPRGIVNVHVALLPQHRGPFPVIYNRLHDPSSCGVTVHVVDGGIDTGPILAQERMAPGDGETVLATMRRLQSRGMELLVDVISDIEAGRTAPLPQSGGSYQGFPDRATIRELRRRGHRLVDAREILLALRTPMGI